MAIIISNNNVMGAGVGGGRGGVGQCCEFGL